ncbi:hypothetical protein CMV30_07125 [Nibricoccus aquaticus]|uniref:Uncharacterized protein n=1 Tax=Nibricoccus aquaticus TaxID=2576891 RepID=A0A290Q964_9BACT|nr:hypothetical protein [Nibricoccus aquaticus]ATC63740.1 hypothetical protein CMV30_07125 [Nibricoccus aquaticus]
MSLTTATLLPGIFLIVLGALLLISNSAIVSTLKAMPRSQVASVLFFGGGAVWFAFRMSGLSEADLILVQSPKPLMIGFSVLALLAFFYLPDFLAVRGLSVLMLLAGTPLLGAAFGEYEEPQRLFMVTAVYIGLAAALYLGAVPYRLRDFFQWLFARPGRSRALGGGLLGYGALLAVVAFTY